MIEYLSHQGSDNSIANTARVSMQFDGNWEELPENYTEEQRDKLIDYLATHKHTSPFRHNSLTIRCKFPIFLARQLGKHQVGLSWNEVSRRYVIGDIEFFYPDFWRAAPEGSIKQGSGGEHPQSPLIMGEYGEYLTFCLDFYDSLIDRGVAPEQARMVLPQSMQTEIVWTGSLMAFAHVYNLRADGHAQKEAQDFAEALDNVIKPLFPVSWKALTGSK